MLSDLTLSGFKSISRAEPIKLSPLSMLCGSNSSGKSTLIQSILMLSQTFGSRFDQDSMVLNGHLVRLGAFGDIKTHVEGSGTIDIGFTINNPVAHYGLAGLKSIECKFNFGRPETIGRSTYSESNFHPPVNRIELTLHKTVDGVDKQESIVLEAPDLQPAADTQLTPQMKGLFHVEACSLSDIDDIAKEYPGYRILGCERNSIIPSVMHLEYDHTRKMSGHVVGWISGSIALRRNLFDEEVAQEQVIIPRNFFESLKNCIESDFDQMLNNVAHDFPQNLPEDLAKRLVRLLESNQEFKKNLARLQLNVSPDIVDVFLVADTTITLSDWIKFLESQPQKERKALSELIDKHRATLQESWYLGSNPDVRSIQVPLRSVYYLASYLSSYFSRAIKYLGPLRNEPQAVYSSLGHTEPGQIGLKGEYTAAALHINRQKIVSYLSPVLRDEHVTFQMKEGKLQEACREWLEYLGVLVDYRTIDRGKLGYEIYVRTTAEDKWQDLTHVGVGVSQVLPIVLMALLSERDDLLIFEQPELHLHPKIQSRLCDFFIAMTFADRQCLVETHSEYLINRLRRRIVQRRDETLIDASSVFFVTKANGLSNFNEVEITRFGVIPDWPDDFFDQTDMEIQQILIEAATKRKEEKKGTAECTRQ